MAESISSMMMLKATPKVESPHVELASSDVQMQSNVQFPESASMMLKPTTKEERSDVQFSSSTSVQALDVDTAWSLFTNNEHRVERMFVENPSSVISSDGQEESTYVRLPSTNTTYATGSDVNHSTSVDVSDVTGLDATYFDLQESKFLVNLHRDDMAQSEAVKQINDIDMNATKLPCRTFSRQNRPSRNSVDFQESTCVVNLHREDMDQSEPDKQINDIDMNDIKLPSMTCSRQNRPSRNTVDLQESKFLVNLHRDDMDQSEPDKQINDIDMNATKLPSLKSSRQNTKCVVKLRRIDDMHQSKSAKEINDIDMNGTTGQQNIPSRKSPSGHIIPLKTARRSRRSRKTKKSRYMKIEDFFLKPSTSLSAKEQTTPHTENSTKASNSPLTPASCKEQATSHTKKSKSSTSPLTPVSVKKQTTPRTEKSTKSKKATDLDGDRSNASRKKSNCSNESTLRKTDMTKHTEDTDAIASTSKAPTKKTGSTPAQQATSKIHVIEPSRASQSSGEHPYTIRMHQKRCSLENILEQMIECADSDLLIFNKANFAYEQNLSFAEQLDDIAIELLQLSSKLQTRAAEIRDKVASVKKANEDDNLQGDATVTSNVVDDLNTDSPNEHDSPETKMASTKADTKFTYVKSNENVAGKFICILCSKSFRSQPDLRNHEGQHTKEFYHCLQCDKVFRSVRSFENHRGTHGKEMFTCPHENCGQQFSLRSSLQNHWQKHSEQMLMCTQSSCEAKFKHRQGYLEHMKWAHRSTKDCPCPICGKKFQTPTHMRSHRRKQHGLIKDLVEGYSVQVRGKQNPSVKKSTQ